MYRQGLPITKRSEILHIIPYFRPAYAFGGPATVSDLVVDGLSRLGHKIRVWTSNIADNTGSKVPRGLQQANGVTVERYEFVMKPLFRAGNLLVTPRMALDAMVREYTPKLIHVHEFRSFQSVCAVLLAKRKAVPIVLQPHGSLKLVLGKVRVKKWYDRLWGKDFLRTAAKIIVLSPLEAEEAHRMGVPNSRIVEIPNGVPLPSKNVLAHKGHFRSRYGIDSRAFIVLYIGRIRESKGMRHLLSAFQILYERNSRATLVMCGPDDGASDKIRHIATRNRLPLIMPGLVTGSHKTAAFVDSDVFCLPSLVETQSMALLEAASHRLPIVASLESAPSQFIAAEAGLFVNLERGALAGALQKLSRSRRLCEDLGSRARAVVERHFYLDLQIRRLAKLYEETSRM